MTLLESRGSQPMGDVCDPVDQLSHSQVDMWLAERWGGLGAAYHLSFGLTINGRLDIDALTAACRGLLRRHPTLLSCFPERDGAPVPARVPVDAWQLERTTEPVVVEEVVRDRVTAPFDIAHGPLVRTTLVTLDRDEQLLLFVCHHLVFDGMSRDIVVRDLAALYVAEVSSTDPDLPALPPYATYVDGEREQARRASADLPTGWRSVAALAADPTRLSDCLPPVGDSAPTGGGVVDFTLAAPVRSRLETLAAAADVSLFTALVATFTVLLDKYGRGSGAAPPVLAIPANTRPAEFRDCVGPFVNELPFRSPPTDDASFRSHLAVTARRWETTLALRSVPVAALRRRVANDTGSDQSPATAGTAISGSAMPGIVFGYRRSAPAPVAMPHLDVRYLPSLPSYASRAELELQLRDDDQTLTGRLTYDRSRLPADVAQQLVTHWQEVIGQVVADPDRQLATWSCLPVPARHTVVVDWNATQVPHTAAPLSTRFEAQAAATPAAIAVMAEGHPPLSYAALNARANRLAHQLRERGVGPETLVAVCAERSPDLVVALLGTLKAGGVYVPLDPEYPPARLRFMLRDSQAPVLLTQTRLRGLLHAPEAVTIWLDALPDPAGEPDFDPAPLTSPGSAAYAIYTSGSTGTPKAAVTSHEAIDNRLAWMQDRYRLSGDDRVLHKTPIGFDVSVWELCWPLLTGAQLVLARPGGQRDGAYLVDLINRAAVTTAHFVPPMLDAFLDQPDVDTCRSLRRVICSGEELPGRLVRRFFARLDAELHNLYGPTEAAIDVTSWQCAPSAADRVPIGRPIANTRLHILDRDLQPVPVGVAGELHIGGVGLARGYLGRPALTADRFVPDPLAGDGSRLYRTGDLACYRTDGTIDFLGRIDHQLKIRGHRVEPGEVEAALLAQPAVRQAVVVARDNPARGHGERDLVGYVVAAPGQPAPREPDLLAQLREQLPGYLVPTAVVCLESLPLTPNGKLDRRALPDPPTGGSGYTAPRSESERLVARVWSELFGVAQIGVDDDFFALGGHSLLATRTVARLRAAAGVELPMRTVFEHPTLGELAAAVERASR